MRLEFYCFDASVDDKDRHGLKVVRLNEENPNLGVNGFSFRRAEICGTLCKFRRNSTFAQYEIETLFPSSALAPKQ